MYWMNVKHILDETIWCNIKKKKKITSTDWKDKYYEKNMRKMKKNWKTIKNIGQKRGEKEGKEENIAYLKDGNASRKRKRRK